MFVPQNQVIDSEFSLLSNEFAGEIGCEIIHLRFASSTQDVARHMAVGDTAVSGAVVIADEQSSGRGRFGRTWISRRGEDLLLSVILKPRAALLGQMTMMASLASAMTVEEHTIGLVTIKWPNDVLLGGEKICGVLAESFEHAGSHFVVLGIGLNVNLDPDIASVSRQAATSIRQANRGRAAVDRVAVFRALLNNLNECFDALVRGETLVPEWRARLETIGQQVEVVKGGTFPSETVAQGLAEDVDESGRLLIRLDDGHLEVVSSGEVTLRSR